MPLNEIASQVMVFLTPFLPALTILGVEGLKEVGEQLGSDTYASAKIIWGKVFHHHKNGQKLKKVAAALAEDQKDVDLQASFARLILETLEESPETANEIKELLQSNRRIQEVLVSEASQVDQISQRLSKGGVQKVTVTSQSKVKSIKQNM